MPVRLVAVAAARKIYAATTIFPLKIERRWQNCGVNALQKRSNALPVAAAAAAAQNFCAATNFPLKMNGSSTIWLQLCCICRFIIQYGEKRATTQGRPYSGIAPKNDLPRNL